MSGGVGSVGFEDHGGVRFMTFGTEWVQGAVRLSRPDWIELEYVRLMMAWMLFRESPAQIAQLGLGAGSIARYCRRRIPEAGLQIVEIDPEVERVCRESFGLPREGPMCRMHLGDALDWVADPLSHGVYDALMVDLYDAQAKGPALDTPEFYAGCAACLAPGGVTTVNLFGEHPSFERNIRAMRSAFGSVLALPAVEGGNVVALASREPLGMREPAMRARAAKIQATTGLPTGEWVQRVLSAAQAGSV